MISVAGIDRTYCIYALGPDDSDDKHERRDDADQDTLDLRVVWDRVWVARNRRLEVVATG